jgi:Tfp pilus assembly protein PilV
LRAGALLPITGTVRAALDRIRRRLRSQAGFGMVELLIAMSVMMIGVLAVYGLLASGLVALARASTQTTAAALADAEMETFRALTYDTILLVSADVTGAPAPYAADPAYRAPGTAAETAATCAAAGCTANAASKIAVGADGENYRVDTYVVWMTTQTQAAQGRLVKRVTIVVRDATTPDTAYARVVSSFDAATGQSG